MEKMKFESIGGHSSSEPLMLITLTATTASDLEFRNDLFKAIYTTLDWYIDSQL